MDPNTANLDPKLKEMYNRVMNTPVLAVSPAGTPPPIPTQQPEPLPQGEAPIRASTTLQADGQPNPVSPQMPLPPMPSAPAAAVPPPQAPQPIPPVPVPAPETPPTTEMHAAIPIPVTPKPISAAVIGGKTKSNKGILTILLIFGGIIFLAVYSIFWIKFFNLSVPFLPF